MNKLHFLIAGIPETTPKPTNIYSGLEQTKRLGLDGMELEFVHSIWLKEEEAEKVRAHKEKLDLVLTIHAPYYINLNSPDNKIRYGSIGRIVNSARIGALAGVYSVTFHSGYYLKTSKEDTYLNMQKVFGKILEQKEKTTPQSIYIRPETTGKGSQFGDLDELLQLGKEFPFMTPCIDFAHLHARSNGQYNTREEFQQVIDRVYTHLGNNGLSNMHIHYSGIEYSEKGERRHLPLDQSDAAYTDLLKVLKESGVKGAFVCESPVRDTDTPLLKQVYESL